MPDAALVTLKDIHKSFGEVVALDGVDWSLAPREVHGLLGGNGAGKTTLMNILYGLYQQDSGTIELASRPVEIASPRAALALGIGMVHQHFLQIGSFSVTENIVLGSSLPSLPILRLDQARERIRNLSQHFGLQVDPGANIDELPMGVRQRVEILKALYRGVKVLILDEPTTNLTPQEVDHLFESLRVMVSEGMSVVFITHKLNEVINVSDRVSVLRDGMLIMTAPVSDVTEESLVSSMVGEEIDVAESILFSGTDAQRSMATNGDPRLRADGITVAGEGEWTALEGVSFEAYRGEILGFAGVAGNGQQELAEALINIQPKTAGNVSINGRDISHMSTREILQEGVAYIPEDRLMDGYLPSVSVAHNLVLGSHNQVPYARRGFMDWDRINETARELIDTYQIRTRGPRDLAANLSGGNIQRLMIARAFSREVQVLLAHNPTSGLDIPSVEFMYRTLLDRRERGLTAILLSDDLDELLLLCDRIATLYRGRLVGILERPEFDRYRIGRMMSGADG